MTIIDIFDENGNLVSSIDDGIPIPKVSEYVTEMMYTQSYALFITTNQNILLASRLESLFLRLEQKSTLFRVEMEVIKTIWDILVQSAPSTEIIEQWNEIVSKHEMPFSFHPSTCQMIISNTLE